MGTKLKLVCAERCGNITVDAADAHLTRWDDDSCTVQYRCPHCEQRTVTAISAANAARCAVAGIEINAGRRTAAPVIVSTRCEISSEEIADGFARLDAAGTIADLGW